MKCQKPVPAPLCQDTCKQAVVGLISTFNNRYICDETYESSAFAGSEALRRQTVQGYDSYCKTLTIANPRQGKCVDGSAIQKVNKCGKFTN